MSSARLEAEVAADVRDSLEWWETDPNQDRHDSHVLLYHGYDLSAFGCWEIDISPCLLCAPAQRGRDPALILTDEELRWGRVVHFVCCGNCGTRGPWGAKESEALAAWNSAWAFHRVQGATE